MNRNNNQQIVLIDVDDTLVTFQNNGEKGYLIEMDGYSQKVYPINVHIDMLKQHKLRGHFVRVHSQGGVDWAEKVIKMLGLEEFVDSVETKPMWYIDDLPANEWMIRVYKYKLLN